MDKQIIDPQIKNAYENTPSKELLFDDPRFQNWLNDVLIHRDIRFKNVRKMKKAGITIIAGSDSPNLATVPGSSLHKEMRLLVERCGFTPIQALATVTSVSGKMLQKTTGIKGLGLIQEGGLADLVVLNGDFRGDNRQTENIHTVISNGRIVDRKQKLNK